MKKLLHERLMDWAGEDCYAPVEIIALRDACFEAARDAFLMMADEIERHYIPRPRFEDGEPIAIGDKFEYRSGSIDEVTRITYKYDDCFIAGANGCSIYASQAKRPSPKVLDADGVEIKVGDTVYAYNDRPNIALKVTAILGANAECTDGSLGTIRYPFDQLTHKEPDSLEKVAMDLKYWCECGGFSSDICEISDRLSALIERME